MFSLVNISGPDWQCNVKAKNIAWVQLLSFFFHFPLRDQTKTKKQNKKSMGVFHILKIAKEGYDP